MPEMYDSRPVNGLSQATMEELRAELNNLDMGMKELLERRQLVHTEIHARIDEARMQLMQSDEHYAKSTGHYDAGMKVAEGPVEDAPIRTGRNGW